jgi:hypothetical protein
VFSCLFWPSLPGIRFDSTHFGLENCLGGETLGFSRRRRSAGRRGALLAFPSKSLRSVAKSLCQATGPATHSSPKVDTGPLVFSDRVAAPCLQADHPRRRSKSTAMSDVPRTFPDHHATIWRYSYTSDSHWSKIRSNSKNTQSSAQTGASPCLLSRTARQEGHTRNPETHQHDTALLCHIIAFEKAVEHDSSCPISTALIDTLE